MNKQKVLVTMLIAAGFISPMAYATNGDTMMAVGSQSTALGGTGVAHFMGADSVWANPAMIGKSKGSELVAGVVMFMPKVSNDGTTHPFTGTSTMADSTANVNYIPDVSYSSRMSNSLTYGIAVAGIAGMGVDYTGSNASYMKSYTALSLMQVVPTVAYNSDNYGVGISPVLQWGSLAISYDATGAGSINYNPDHNKDQYTGYGFNLGGYYDVTKDLTVAAAYFSEVEMKYGNQISGAGAGFNLFPGSPAGEGFGDTLTQPAQMKAGVSYNVTSSVTVTADYKLINWAGAKGYKDFNWKDQNVVAVGVKYTGNGFWLGAGYNSADDPIGALPAATYPGQYRNAAVNFFNNVLFPAVVKESYTFGGGYSFSKSLDLELAAVITPEVKKTVDVSAMVTGLNGGTPVPNSDNTTKHSQSSYSVSLRYKF